jgi:hypothetical protein
VAVVALLIGPGLAILDDGGQPTTRPTSSGPAIGDRAGAAATLLGELSAALASGDRRGLDALADPGAPAASRELSVIADNVQALGIAPLTFRYVDDSGVVLTEAQQAALGERSWLADVEVTWQLSGIHPRPSVLEVPVALGWHEDRAVFRTARVSDGRRSPLWLLEPVAVRRTPRAVVIALNAADARRLLRVGARAVATVRSTIVDWPQPLVVEALATSEQFLAASGLAAEAAEVIAAVTTTTDGAGVPGSPAHVYVNLPVFDELGPVGRQVVLSHEAVHVALGSPTRDVPVWLAEGIADYVALAESASPVRELAAEIRRLVRDRGAPRRLPEAEQLDGSDPDVGAWYEASWLAVRLIAEEYGEPALLAFYQAAERGRGTDRAFTDVLGTTQDAFVERWRAELLTLAP